MKEVQTKLKKLRLDYIDEEIEVADQIYEVFEVARKLENAYISRMKYHRAYYSLDYNDGIEKYTIKKVKAPNEIIITQELKQELLRLIYALPEKQARRIYEYFYLDMSLSDIARMDNVHKSSVSESIVRGLKSLKNIDFEYFTPIFE